MFGRCIPYRSIKRDPSSCVQQGSSTPIDDLEFLLISSQKNPRMMFPKVYRIFTIWFDWICMIEQLIMQGGWEIDESLEEAASRETFEEAGVVGEVQVQVCI